MKSKCLKFFLSSTLSFLFLGLLFFCLPLKSANATVSIGGTYYSYKVNPASGIVTATNFIDSSCSNSLVLVTIVSYPGTSFSSPYYNGVAMTDVGFSQQDDTIYRSRYQTFYLQNPASGTKDFTVNSGNSTTVIFQTFCNVDQTTPIQSVVQHNNSWGDGNISSGYFDITSDGSMVVMNLLSSFDTLTGDVSYTPTSGLTSNSTVLQTYDYSHSAWFQSFVGNFDTQTNKSVGASMSAPGSYYFGLSENVIVLNYAPSPYCGDSVCNNGETLATCIQDCTQSGVNYVGGSHTDAVLGGYYQIPVYWDVCGDYSNINSASITFTPNDTGVKQDYALWAVRPKTEFIGPQKCSGLIYYDGYVPLDSTATSGFITLTLYGTSTTPLLDINTVPFDVSLGDPTPGAYITSIYSKSVYELSGATTTPIIFTWNMGSLAWGGTNICLYKDSGTGELVSGSSTGLCVAVTATSSSAVIYYPISTSTDFFSGYLGSDTFDSLQSSNIGILFFGKTWKEPGEVDCVPPVLDTTHDCDGFDTSGSVLSMGQMQCAFAKGFHVIGYVMFVPHCSSINTFKDNYSIFKRGFPFNAFFDITDTIDSAIASSSESATTSIGIPFINPSSTSSNKFYIIPVVSSSSLSNAIGSDNRNTFRLTIGFIMWILAAVTVYFTVRKV